MNGMFTSNEYTFDSWSWDFKQLLLKILKTEKIKR